MRFNRGFLTAAAAALIVGATAPAGAQTFFGQDFRWVLDGPATTAGTNSAAMRENFLTNLTGAGTEDFESFSDRDPSPLALTFTGRDGNPEQQRRDF